MSPKYTNEFVIAAQLMKELPFACWSRQLSFLTYLLVDQITDIWNEKMGV